MTDLWIAGLGIQTVNQITREVEQALRASREVLYLDTGVPRKATWRGCARGSARFLSRVTAKIGRASALTSTWPSASWKQLWIIHPLPSRSTGTL